MRLLFAPLAALTLAPGRADAHGAMTFPRPRNAIDGQLAAWTNWSYPCEGNAKGGDCAITFAKGAGTCPMSAYSGQENHLNASNGQSCYWFSNGCTVGCGVCDGTANHVGHGGQSFLFKNMTWKQLVAKNISMPNPYNPEPGTLTMDPKSVQNFQRHPVKPNCANPTAKPTLCDPRLRTVNTQAACGSPEDIYYYSPWRYPGNAPVIDACGSAGGRFSGQGHGGAGATYTNTSVAKQGDMGSHLPAMAPQATVRAGGLLETRWTVMANHGGGYAYRIARADGPLTEASFGENPLDFVGLSALRWDGDAAMQLSFNATEKGWETNVGTVPKGSTWRKVPIPNAIWERTGPQFEPVCQESEACIDAVRFNRLHGGAGNPPVGTCRCSTFSNGGPLLPNVEMVDTVRIPSHLAPGKFVLQWRWDCEESDQVWASCSDITIAE